MLYGTVTYNGNNLRKHGLSRLDADELLETDLKIEVPMSSSARGNERIMLVGFNADGELLEVGVEVFSEIHVHVFHGDKAGKRSRKRFEQFFER